MRPSRWPTRWSWRAVTPGVVCLAQGDRTLTASGAGFLQIADAPPHRGR
ncbi:MAG: hypothetical protein R3F43_15375 [bacterium]